MQTVPPAWRQGLLVAGIFFVIAVSLAGVLPLWLDEIIQLVETRNSTPAGLIHILPSHPGSAPLGYLFQQAVLRVAGYSVRWARFPSALFASGAVFLTALLGAGLGLKKPWAGAALFGLFPLTLRYACESRTYAQALFFSTLATVVFVRLAKSPGWLIASAYWLTLTAAVYTQPYAIFVIPAHVVWAAVFRYSKTVLWSTLAGALAVLAFIPWYLWTKTFWEAGIEGAGVHFSWSLKIPLMFFRETIGAGYWGSGLLVVLFALAVFSGWQSFRIVVLSILLITTPAVLAIVADSAFNYFVATRQIIWILPAAAVLAALGIEKRARYGLAVAVVLAGVCVWQDMRFFTAPRENWQAAANAISAQAGGNACVMAVPPIEIRSYAFFRPELAATRCPAPRTVVAFTPYATGAQREAAIAALNSEGYSRLSGSEAGRSEIFVFSR